MFFSYLYYLCFFDDQTSSGTNVQKKEGKYFFIILIWCSCLYPTDQLSSYLYWQLEGSL